MFILVVESAKFFVYEGNITGSDTRYIILVPIDLNNVNERENKNKYD